MEDFWKVPQYKQYEKNGSLISNIRFSSNTSIIQQLNIRNQKGIIISTL